MDEEIVPGKLIHGLDDQDAGSLIHILKATGGFSWVNITVEAPVLPFIRLEHTLDYQRQVHDEFVELYRSALNTYGVPRNKEMVLVAREQAIFRPASEEEIEADIDHFGIEQILWPINFYESQINKRWNPEEDPKPTFPLLGEDHIYVGPPRLEKAVFSTYVDTWPGNVDFREGCEVIESMVEEGPLIGSGGVVAMASSGGMTSRVRIPEPRVNPQGPPGFRSLAYFLNRIDISEMLQAARNASQTPEAQENARRMLKEIHPSFMPSPDEGSARTWYANRF